EDVWILVWAIPLELWMEDFFILVASLLGSFIEIDPKTKSGEEMAVLRMRIRKQKAKPLPHQISVLADNREILLPLQMESND
ncbi:DUF4283 domain-containing protein, partial [Mycobacterium kansasii]